jgi:serine/threonine protein kinase
VKVFLEQHYHEREQEAFAHLSSAAAEQYVSLQDCGFFLFPEASGRMLVQVENDSTERLPTPVFVFRRVLSAQQPQQLALDIFVHPPLFWRLAVALLGALSAMHRAWIIHCDLKPGNVLISVQDDPPLRVIDFSSWNRPGDVGGCVGTRGYRAPETLRTGQSLESTFRWSEKQDVWSAAVTLCTYICGKHPLRAKLKGVQNPKAELSVIQALGKDLRDIMLSVETPEVQRLLTTHRDFTDEAIQFMQEMLRLRATERPTVADLLTKAQRQLAITSALYQR